MAKLRFYSDPGHGWLEVPVAELSKLGILEKVSPYSYFERRSGMAYLEEDCDLSLYLRARGISVDDSASFFSMHISEVNCPDYSWIRDLPSFSSIQKVL